MILSRRRSSTKRRSRRFVGRIARRWVIGMRRCAMQASKSSPKQAVALGSSAWYAQRPGRVHPGEPGDPGSKEALLGRRRRCPDRPDHPARRSGLHPFRQRPGVRRRGRAAMDRRGRRPDRLHRARFALGERLHRELQCAAARRASGVLGSRCTNLETSRRRCPGGSMGHERSSCHPGSCPRTWCRSCWSLC